MPAVVIALALLGLVGIVAGFLALRKNWLIVKENETNPSHQRRFWLVILLGVALAIGSWLFTFFMGYPINIELQPGRVVGVPFFVAYFDSEGRDYVGPLTMPGAIANSVFWFFIPQLLLRFSNRGSTRNVQT